MVRHLIETYWKEVHLQNGYELLYSPHIAKVSHPHLVHAAPASVSTAGNDARAYFMQVDLWKTSGHFDFYGENMFDQMKVENEEYQLRPMNCPFHIAIYKACRHRFDAATAPCTASGNI